MAISKKSHKLDYKSKVWLNPDTTAFIFTEYFRDYEKSYVTLKMADCRHVLEFDAFINSEDERDKLLKKISIMIDELSKFNKELEGIQYD